MCENLHFVSFHALDTNPSNLTNNSNEKIPFLIKNIFHFLHEAVCSVARKCLGVLLLFLKIKYVYVSQITLNKINKHLKYNNNFRNKH